MRKLISIINYLADRLKEQSTWQGIGFVVGLTGSRIGAGLDWGQAAALGSSMVAVIKMLCKDKKDA